MLNMFEEIVGGNIKMPPHTYSHPRSWTKRSRKGRWRRFGRRGKPLLLEAGHITLFETTFSNVDQQTNKGTISFAILLPPDLSWEMGWAAPRRTSPEEKNEDSNLPQEEWLLSCVCFPKGNVLSNVIFNHQTRHSGYLSFLQEAISQIPHHCHRGIGLTLTVINCDTQFLRRAPRKKTVLFGTKGPYVGGWSGVVPNFYKSLFSWHIWLLY